MRKRHVGKLKLHTFFSIAIAVVFLSVLLVAKDISLVLAMLFLSVYVLGNGIIHTKYNELKRDTLIEYGIVSLVVAVVMIGLF